jgi:hypothetical protein
VKQRLLDKDKDALLADDPPVNDDSTLQEEEQEICDTQGASHPPLLDDNNTLFAMPYHNELEIPNESETFRLEGTPVHDSYLNMIDWQKQASEMRDALLADEFLTSMVDDYCDEVYETINEHETTHEASSDEEECENTKMIDLQHNQANTDGLEEWSIYNTEMRYPRIAADEEAGYYTPKINHEKTHKRFNNSEPILTEMQDASDEVTDKYFDQYNDVLAALNKPGEFDERSHMSCTYLGNLLWEPGDEFELEGSFPITHQAYTKGMLATGDEMTILIDTGATRSFMSRSFYDKSPSLHKLPKLKPLTKYVTVGDGRDIQTMFTIPLTFSVQGHVFEMYTIVLKTNKAHNLIWGIKAMIETETVISLRSLRVSFLNRSAPIVPKEDCVIRPGESREIKVDVIFPEELSGIAVAKVSTFKEPYCKHTTHMRITRNSAIIGINNVDTKEIVLSNTRAIGIVDVRSLGYFHVNRRSLECEMATLYEFSDIRDVCNDINEQITFINEQRRHSTTTTEYDSYPWLDADDPRKYMTDEEIIRTRIDLSKSELTPDEKEAIYKLAIRYKKAFSLRDEVGECPNITVNIDVLNKEDFFKRPFTIAECDKPNMDFQMGRLVHLGILSKNSTSHTSPVMLISRKLTKDKRPIVDFRLLNTRIRHKNIASPLLKDIFTMLGKEICEMMSCVDIKDAFHSLRLSPDSKEYCGILPYFGSTHYRYERLPMGLAISPAVWVNYINYLLEHLVDKSKFIAIMDDLLIHSTKDRHFELLQQLLESLESHGLKLSPKKCQLFMKELVYMGHIFSIKDNRMTMRALRTRIEAIKNMPPPRTPKQCKSFCGVVNFVSLFCPELQALLAPIHRNTKKGAPFKWLDEHKNNFEEIKKRLCSAPILHLPQPVGRFILYSDTSRRHVGSALWQVQEGKPQIIGYASKTLQEACLNYSVTELEMYGLFVNVTSWKWLLYHVHFDCAVDHQAAVFIMKSKNEPATARISRLIELLSSYAFNLYYVKGKDLILTDFLSRIESDTSDPSTLIPISFLEMAMESEDPLDTLMCFDNEYDQQEICARTEVQCEDSLTVMTRATAKKKGIEMPEVRTSSKVLDPHVKPEHQLRRTIEAITNPQQRIAPEEQMVKEYRRDRDIATSKHGPMDDDTSCLIPLPEPPLPDGVEDAISRYLPGFELDDPRELELVEPRIRRPQPIDLATPPALSERVDPKKYIHRFLPKQGEIDKLLTQINRKILRQCHLPVTLKDIQAAYLRSPTYRDVYKYLFANKQPTNCRPRHKVDADARHYFVMDTLLFKITRNPATQDFEAVLCIPTSKVDVLLRHYHSSTVGGHMGAVKTYVTLSKRFHSPKLMDNIVQYIRSCHVCQMFKAGQKPNRPHQKRINLNVPALTKLSMDIKHMNTSSDGYNFILILLCEVSNFIVAIPLKKAQTKEICKAIMNGYIKYFGTPTHIIGDQDPAFLSNLAKFFFGMFDIKLVTVSTTNHQSLLAEHGIKSISNILMKHLSGLGDDWPKYVGPSMMSYNAYGTPNLAGFSPFELAFGRKARIIPTMEINIDVPLTGTYRQYVDMWKEIGSYLRKYVHQHKNERTDFLNKDKEELCFTKGQIVYMFNPSGALLQTGSRKIANEWVGPLVVCQPISPTQFILMTLNGLLIPQLVEESRIKAGWIPTYRGNVDNVYALLEVIEEILQVLSEGKEGKIPKRLLPPPNVEKIQSE